jgi:putative aldouronate transport system permease protein
MLVTGYFKKAVIMIEDRTAGEKITNIVLCAVLVILAFMCLYPLIYCVSVSFSDAAAVMAGRVTILPVKPTLSAYNKIMEDKGFMQAFLVSVLRVVVGGTINIVFTITMAYPLSKSKQNFHQRNIYMWFLVFTMLFSAGLIPWYLTIKNLGILNTFWALVLPGAVPVYNVILLMNFFRSNPVELEEAAFVDGASPLDVLLRIYLPISKPGIATVMLFSIVGHWNNYFDGLVLINKPKLIPLQTFIQKSFILNLNNLNLSPQELAELAKTSSLTLNSAKIVITTIPILLIYPFLQRYFTSGLVMGAVKE